jgi:hypothetical protein
MQNRGIITDKFTLQWDPAGRTTRQAQSCSLGGLSVCAADNGVKKALLFGPLVNAPDVTNCDEFPFAGSMEGGSAFIGLNPASPLGVTRTCVPAYQNNMQGQCNSMSTVYRLLATFTDHSC